jgi:hypothetical protein
MNVIRPVLRRAHAGVFKHSAVYIPVDVGVDRIGLQKICLSTND